MKVRPSHHRNHRSASRERDLLTQFTQQVAEVETQRLESLAAWASRLATDSASDAVGSSSFLHA